jgi:surface-anchored protein
MKKQLALATLITLGSLTGSPAFAQVNFTTEHLDLNMKYVAATNKWDMVVRDDDSGGVETAAADARLLVPEAALVSRPAGNYAFTGVGAGQSLYVLPALQDPGLLFLGVAGYGTTPTSQWTSYNANPESGGRVTSSAGRWLRLKLESVTGAGGAAAPGIFSTWQEGFSGPNAFMSTNDGITNSGTATDDSIWVLSNGHSHYNWGFSAPGTYEVSFRPSGQQGGVPVESADVFTFIFQVGSSALVPEPSTALLLLFGSLTLLKRQKIKDRKICV